MRSMYLVLGVSFLLLLSHCSLSPLPPTIQVNLKTQIEGHLAGHSNPFANLRGAFGANFTPAQADKFNCYIVSISGSGILNTVTTADAGGMSPACLGLEGVTSIGLSDDGLTKGISINIPASSSQRTIKILGVSSSQGCTEMAIPEIFAVSNSSSVYLLATQTATFTSDQNISITIPRALSSPQDLVGQCGSRAPLPLAEFYGVVASGSPSFTNPPTVPPTVSGNVLHAFGTQAFPFSAGTSSDTPMLVTLFEVPTYATNKINSYGHLEFGGVIHARADSFGGGCTAPFDNYGAGFKPFLFTPSGSIAQSNFATGGNVSRTLNLGTTASPVFTASMGGIMKTFIEIGYYVDEASANCKGMTVSSVFATLAP